MNAVIMEVLRIRDVMKKKRTTDKQIRYIIKTVLYPIIEYRTKGIYLTKTEANKITMLIKAIFREKANISRETAAATIAHPDIYDIPTIEDLQSTARIAETVYDLNSIELEGQVLRNRLAQMQYQGWTQHTPLAKPI